MAPMSQEARQFHHIMDVVDGMDEETLRDKVKHLPLFIAAKNYERQRLNHINNAAALTTTSMHENTHFSTPYYTSIAPMNSLVVSNFGTQAPTSRTTNTKPKKRNFKSIDYFSRDRSFTTNEYLVTNTDQAALAHIAHIAITPAEIVSPNNDHAELELAADGCHVVLNATPYLGDECLDDNCDDLSNNHTSTSSGSGPAKRRWGNRKSPNSRIAHNMNEKNRRADLRESLERLKLALPQFKHKNCKSTTSDILQQGYKHIKESIALHKELLEQRTYLFEAARICKAKICQLMLANRILIYSRQSTPDPYGDAPPKTITSPPRPLSDASKMTCQRYLELNELMNSESIYNIEFNRVLYPSLDYNAIENARKKYLQTASINVPYTMFKYCFHLLEKSKLLPPSNTITSKKESSRAVDENTNGPYIGKIYDLPATAPTNTYIADVTAFPPPFKALKTSQPLSDEEQLVATNPHVSSPLMAYSMVSMPQRRLNFYRSQFRNLSLEETPTANVDPNNSQNSVSTSLINTTTSTANSSSTNSVIGTTSILHNSIDGPPPIVNEFINTSRDSYSSNTFRISFSANISDEDNSKAEYFNENQVLMAENRFPQDIDSKTTTSKSSDSINTSRMVNSNSKSNG